MAEIQNAATSCGRRRSKLSLEDSAVDLQIKSREELQKKAVAEVKAVLSRHPYAAEHALKALHAQGFTKTSQVLELPSSRASQAYKQREEAKKKTEVDEIAELAAFYRVKPSEIIPPRYKQLSDLPHNTVIESLLEPMEKATCSKSNMRAMLQRFS